MLDADAGHGVVLQQGLLAGTPTRDLSRASSELGSWTPGHMFGDRA